MKSLMKASVLGFGTSCFRTWGGFFFGVCVEHAELVGWASQG